MFDHQWEYKGKKYDTKTATALGTKTGEFKDFDDDGDIVLVETLYRFDDGMTFAHTHCTRDNGAVDHSVHIYNDGGKAWLATLPYAKKRQN